MTAEIDRDRETVVEALERCEGVYGVELHWWTSDSMFRVEVLIEDGENPHSAVISEPMQRFDLVIWCASFGLPSVTVVPREGFKHIYDDEDMGVAE